MLYLLSEEQKIKISREYSVRRFVVFLCFSFAVALLALVFIAPSYFLSHTKQTVVEERATALAQSNITEQARIAALSLEDAQKKIAILKPGTSSFSPQDLFRKVLSYKSSQIAIASLSFWKEPRRDGEVKIAGVAENRESLVLYVKGIEKIKMFSKVDFPVSNLAKDKNINFLISAVLSSRE